MNRIRHNIRYSLIIPFFFLLIINFTSPAKAYFLFGTDCDTTDPNYAGVNYCNEQCATNVGSQPSVTLWCGTNGIPNVVGTCVTDTVTQNPLTDICNCSCSEPSTEIECIDESQFDSRYCVSGQFNCVGGKCLEPGGSECSPWLGDSQCDISEGGPCNPDDYDSNYQPRCIDDDLDGVGRCVCTSDQFFGNQGNLKIFCDPLDPSGPPISDSGPDDNPNALYTAIGCIDVAGINDFVASVLPIVLGIGGSIALVIIAIGGFMIKTSIGDPGKLKMGKGLIVAAITALLLMTLSAFFLRIMGVDILGIPGLGI